MIFRSLSAYHRQALLALLTRLPRTPYIQRRLDRLHRSQFKHHGIHETSIEERFTWIHRNNYWSNAESISGPGSTLEQTATIRSALPRLVEDFKLRRILDVPCGDFNWMRHVLADLDVAYIGGDIVRDMVDGLQAKYGDARIAFRHIDLTRDPLPPADVLLCRDCLFHLSFADTRSALENFVRSGIPYLLTTTHKVTPDLANTDIPTGHFRRIDLFSAPYSLPSPPLARFDDWTAPQPEREMCLWTSDQVRAALSISGTPAAVPHLVGAPAA